MFKNDSLSFKKRNVKKFLQSFSKNVFKYFIEKKNTIFLNKISIEKN